jgi:hypothetical protein
VLIKPHLRELSNELKELLKSDLEDNFIKDKIANTLAHYRLTLRMNIFKPIGVILVIAFVVLLIALSLYL